MLNEGYGIPTGFWGSDASRIIVVEDFLEKDKADILYNYIKNNQIWHSTQPTDEWKDRVHTHDQFTDDVVLSVAKDVIHRVQKHIEKTMCVTLSMGGPSMVKWRVGNGINPAHIDRTEYGKTYDISSLLYLNDSYAGGSIYFPNQDKTIRPVKGNLIFFPSDSNLPHGVTTVEEGERYTMPNFWQVFSAKNEETGEIYG